MQCKEQNQIDRLKSSFGIGNKGRLQTIKKRNGKDKKKDKIKEEILILRQRWYERFKNE